MTTLFLAIATACTLLGVPVRDCNPIAQSWLAGAQRLPQQHWALIDELRVRETAGGRTSSNDGRVVMGLPKKFDLRTAEHELGHVVGYKLDLYGAYEARFWRNGKPLGKTTKYGRNNGPSEDFAECYKLVLRDGQTSDECDPDRKAFIVQHAFSGKWPAPVR